MKYDLLVLGGGAAGFSAATVAAEAGYNVALVTEGPLGGTCVNYGCVPTKRMLHVLSREARGLASLVEDARLVANRIRRDKYENLVEKLGIRLVRGRGRFASRNVVEVGGEKIAFRKAVIAVGARAWRPPIPGLQEASRVLDNESLMGIREDPSSVVVLGGRAQAVEVAQILARTGVEVTLVQRSPRLMPTEEPEVGAELKRVLEDDGVRVVTGARVLGIEEGRGTIRVSCEAGGRKVFEGEYVYLATGRRPRLGGLGLEKLGVSITSEGFIRVDTRMRAAPGVYAAGDCTGEPMLEPVAAKEGYVAAVNALGLGSLEMDYSLVPRAVFTIPEYARVGYTEAEYMASRGVCSCRTVPLDHVPRMGIEGAGGFAKLVADPRDWRIVGFHMVGTRASEVVHEAAIAIRAGMTVDDVIDTVHVFPTSAEALKYAALAFRRDVETMPCCLL